MENNFPFTSIKQTTQSNNIFFSRTLCFNSGLRLLAIIMQRTVLEAVTAILGGRPRVGVLQEGKKVRDDNKTLHQVGISHGDKLDNLGFTLEPNPRQSPAPLTSSEDPNFLSIGCAPEPLDR